LGRLDVGSYLIKPQLDVDLYVWWSNNTDLPVTWGTKKQFKKLYKKRDWMWRLGEDFKTKLKLADETGFSTRWHMLSREIAYGGYGTILIENIPALLAIWATDLTMPEDDPRLMWLVDKHEWVE